MCSATFIFHIEVLHTVDITNSLCSFTFVHPFHSCVLDVGGGECGRKGDDTVPPSFAMLHPPPPSRTVQDGLLGTDLQQIGPVGH